jgi:hypothetical protein
LILFLCFFGFRDLQPLETSDIAVLDIRYGMLEARGHLERQVHTESKDLFGPLERWSERGEQRGKAQEKK